MNETHRSIAIDGPAGAGKSTIAKALAARTGFTYIDTGAMYRTLALYLLDTGEDLSDEAAVVTRLKDADIAIRHAADGQRMMLNGEDVTTRIRNEEVSDAASRISVYEQVRAHMVAMQQEMAKTTDVVMDGRDIGTVVLPFADLKIYLTASAEERARRRMKEYAEKGIGADFEEVVRDIEERDHRDMTREHSPLKKAEDATEVDCSELTIEEVTEKILSLWK